MTTSFPKTYKAAAFVTKGQPLELVQKDWKNPEAGQIAIKVLACGVCHSDAAVQHQHMPTGLPRVPGHEVVGDVVAVGPGETYWKVGARVGGGWHGGHCGVCASCRSGDFITCAKQGINGIFSDGGYGEYCILRSEAVVAIPEDMDPAEAAPLLCAGVTTYNSIRNMGIKAGEVVAIQGIGGLGHLALQFCAAMGFRTVALSSSASKEKLAKELGATDYIDGSKVSQVEELQKMGGAKLVVCTAPNPAVIKDLVMAMAPGGTLLVLTVIPELTVPYVPFIQKKLSLRGWPSGTAKDSEETIAFARLSGVKCRIEKFPLDKATDAWESMITGAARFRAVIVP